MRNLCTEGDTNPRQEKIGAAGAFAGENDRLRIFLIRRKSQIAFIPKSRQMSLNLENITLD